MSESKITSSPRPLSPHLSVYRWQLHMVLSILHRATGAAMAVSLPVLVLWLWAAAYSPECFVQIAAFFHTGIGKLMLIGWSFAFYLHFCSGIRHLFWDTGAGFEIHTVTRTGMAVVFAALAATAGTWWVICSGAHL